jgi:RNA polymerase sigma factor (sigma-70 family)
MKFPLRLVFSRGPSPRDDVVTSTPVRDDEQLFSAWQGGDRSAGEALIERHYDAVLRFFRTKTGGHADDLVQRVFLVCADRGTRFRGDSTFRAFLFGIARNVLFEFLRSKLRDGARDPDFATSSILDLAPGVSTMAVQRAEQRLLVQALHRLPVDLQMAVELYYWEELSVNELSVVLQIPPGTVKSRLYRAREVLKSTMEAIPALDDRESVRGALSLWDAKRPSDD